jgi:phage terminase large subunit-like protein
LLTPEEKRELVALSIERDRRRQERKLFDYRPYPKQIEFHTKGKTERERLLMAGNQLGKTWCMGFELAMHLTGEYPEAGKFFYPTREELLHRLPRAGVKERMEIEGLLENLGILGLYGADVYPNGWPGRRFNKPVWWWASSVSGTSTRDNPQRILVGPPGNREAWGTGAIPKANLVGKDGKIRASMATGTPNLIDTLLVQHKTGGQSILGFKTYEQGRERWQGPTLDGVWYDEEPPLDIYEEGLTRTNTTEGPNDLTFTPLLGMSNVVRLFISIDDEAEAAA